MQAQLVAVEGPLRGNAWPIDGKGLVLGRDIACAVRLNDRLASRRHCRLVVTEERLCLEDLGARNPALINGEPARAGVLRIGDTIGVGGELFLLTGASDTALQEGAGADKTISLGDYLALHLPDQETIRIERDISTVDQLAHLFESTARLAACESTGTLIAAARDTLIDWFSPARLWIARPRHERATTYFAVVPKRDDAVRPYPPAEVERAMQDQLAAFVPPSEEGRGAFLIAPLKINSGFRGSVALEGGEMPLHKRDLRVLRLYCTVLASFLESLQLHEQLARDNARLRMRAGEALEFVGASEPARYVREQAARAAQSDLNVLITGETGTGKELVARLIHQGSSRSAGPFVVVNCAAIPDELFESEIFGHARGAFTDAHASFEGLLSQADGGTLLLDEVADLSMHNQARMLRAIEHGVYRRLGEHDERTVDVRVLAATNRDVAAAMEDGRFRVDLYHRLNGFEIAIPPLRERVEDIPDLAGHFLELGRGLARRPLEGFAPETLGFLAAEAWPGNVRELRTRILRAVGLADGPTLSVDDMRMPAPLTAHPRTTVLSLREAEKRHIIHVLRECGYCVRTAAGQLGVSRSTLYKKIADFGIAL